MDMSENLQTLLKEALLNNSYDYDVMHNTLKSTWMNSYSYLYYLQKANIGYEELFFFSNDVDSRNSKLIGKLYLDKSSYANFDVDYDLISIFTREEYRVSQYYQVPFTYHDMVYHPEIFTKLPIVIIDDQVIFDYKVTVRKDCTTFTLPYRRNFVIEDGRNSETDGIIYIDHKIQVLVIDNIFYQRYTYNKTSLLFNKTKKTITIAKNAMTATSKTTITKEVNSEVVDKYNMKSIASLTNDQQYEVNNEIKRRLEIVKLPAQDGIMFASLHFLNGAGRGYELGTSFIMMEDDGEGNYVGTLTDDIADLVSNQSYDIYVDMIFFNRLYEHKFYDGSQTTIATDEGADLFVLEDKGSIPYNSPIPVENFMVMKRTGTSGWYLEKNTDMLEMHYPNIYKIKDESMTLNDEYRIFYFYYRNDDLAYTVVFDFYFKFLLDVFSDKSLEEIINNIYYNKADLSMYTDDEKNSFERVFQKIYDYKWHHHMYGDTDFVTRYLQIEGNEDKEPIEYKDETLKEWIRIQPWVLRDYVIDQNKVGDSYHLFANTIDLESRLRTDTSIELGNKNIRYFDESRYVFAFENERDYPELLDCRVFVDGILVEDVYQRRKLFMDYFYIPKKYVEEDSYIELEIFPRYKFSKDILFESMDDKVTVTIAEPEENIYPTTADIIFEEDSDEVEYSTVEAKWKEGYRIDLDGNEIEDSDFFLGTLNVSDKAVALESTFLVYRDIDYPVYSFYDSNGDLISTVKNNAYTVNLEYVVFRCYTHIPENTKVVKVSCYKSPDNTTNLHDYSFKISEKYIPLDFIPTRFSNELFKITAHYDRGNFEVESDDLEKPVKFTRLTTFDIEPKEKVCLNRAMKVKFSKIPVMVRFLIDQSGYAYIELGEDDFKFDMEYIRIFRNGRLIPQERYRLLTTYERPRIIFVDWFDVGDIIYIDITPYRYTRIYHKSHISKEETLIDLRGIINKPFDIRYYDVYMNGRKLSLNNVFSITPWEITLVNLKSNYNLDIYEKERDWEYFGLDYNSDIYYFTLDNLINSGIVSDEEFCKLIMDRIEELKDERLIINPNTFDEEAIDYSDVDMIYPILFIFYYDHLVPKTYVNPDILQFSSEVLLSDFPEIYNYYFLDSELDAKDELQQERRIVDEYPDVLCLDPDTYIVSSGKGSEKGVHVQVKDKASDDFYYDEDGNLILDAERKQTDDEVEIEGDEVYMNMNDQAYADETEAELSDGAILVYDVGHSGDVDQSLLDQNIEILSQTNYVKKGDA